MISNGSLNKLLVFLKAWLNSLPGGDFYITTISSLLPTSLYGCYKYLGISRDAYTKYVVCKKCYKLYRIEECFSQVGGNKVPQVCKNQLKVGKKRFQSCGAQLLKKVKCKGKVMYHPIKVYCFKSIIDTLECYLLRPGFQEECERWRDRKSEDYLSDIYDGQVWKEFNVINGENFLKAKNTYAFMINVDWFQPYKRRPDFSVGAIYMVLLNLPREKRFLQENVFLVGVIPSFGKEPSCINSFLEPLVEELLILYRGLRVKTFQNNFGEKVRAALLAAASDIPAARKLSGFLSHSAHKGCSKCFKTFPGSFGEKRNYGGFDRHNWPSRTLTQHKANIEQILAAQTSTKRKKLESEFGIRYSVLLKLPYFNPIRHTVIDPMHNLFLGIAKTCFKLWVNRDILTKSKLENMEVKIARVELGGNLGRLPSKISSNYGSFTAEQWRNWICIYSMYVLDGILPERDLKCWQTFVLACRHLCHPAVTSCDVTIADCLFLKFAKEFEAIYGDLAVTPNIHMMLHLKECVLDYGSVYGFWLFAFERYNGILGSIPSNNKNIEPQLMSKFLNLINVYNLQFSMPSVYSEHVQQIVSTMYLNESFPTIASEVLIHLMKMSNGPLNSNQFSVSEFVTKSSHYKLMTLEGDMLVDLKTTYASIYPSDELSCDYFPSIVKVFDTVSIQKMVFGSKRNKNRLKAAKITGKWSTSSGHIDFKEPERLGEIAYFIEHCVKSEKNVLTNIFAVVDWYCDANLEQLKCPLLAFSADNMVPQGPSRYLPVWRIHSQCAVACEILDGRKVQMVTTIPQKLFV